MFILHDPRKGYTGRRISAHIMDVAPTLLDLMEIPIPNDIQGQVIRG
jgi:arylsulfatase A-like enzyme